ncbi:TPA: SMP-30/gluconolactonase/LRE family protein [Providencia rettgeri]|uniref:SMP-30/gluconolactonase/LRE family protein n=1 Tax=Providencia TaxID=586 RepID=UPI00234AF558|nr:SMP-30/gluconolactonase/LRE family protein [Providencia sp. PROV032]HEC8323493.1 SMP-30/gluconolactonase/LRE family protein [Providencia rettgeri]
MSKSIFAFDTKIIKSPQAELGESPIWCYHTNSLLWVDIKKGKLFRFYPNLSDAVEVQNIPTLTSAVLPTNIKDLFVLINIDGIYVLNYKTRELSVYFEFKFNNKKIRTNECQVSPDGNIFISVMDKNANNPIGVIYEFNAERKELNCIHSNLLIPNTMQWFGGGFWFADSGRKVFYRKDLNTNAIKEYPVNYIADGSALTKEGILINACWGDKCLALYDLNNSMQLIGRIIVDSSQPTSCLFSGVDHSTLYVTSAYDGLEKITINDGMVTSIKTNFIGQPSNTFVL